MMFTQVRALLMEVIPWTASLLMIGGAIGPKDDDTEELSMKAPMSVSKPADLR